MHHWFIQHAWYAGAKAFPNAPVRKLLQSLGDSGLNLIPIPGPINNALGKSTLATASFAHKTVTSINEEVRQAADQFSPLFSGAK